MMLIILSTFSCSQPSITTEDNKSAIKKGHKSGLWKVARTTNQDEMLEQLQSIGYLSGYTPAHNTSGVTIYKKESVYDGYNLYISGHGPHAILMDMNGNILHTWSYYINLIWPGLKLKKLQRNTHWRRIHLFENGDILAIYEGIGMIKIDKDSNLLWSHQGWEHHDMAVLPDGTIYALTRKYVKKNNKKIFEDLITVLDSNGLFIREYSVLEMFNQSNYSINNLDYRKKDPLHTNSIRILDGSLSDISPVFKKGNVLISIRNEEVVGIIDLEKGEFVWGVKGRGHRMWKRQHEPVLLENGNMLVFDNLGDKRKRGKSRVIEFDPFTLKIVWKYAGDTTNILETKTCGMAERLPNGNTLIIESNNGRAIEVTKDKKIVWEYLSIHRAGINNKLVANIPQMNRIDKNHIKWLTIQEDKELPTNDEDRGFFSFIYDIISWLF